MRRVWSLIPLILLLLLTTCVGLYMALAVPLYAKPLEIYHVDVVDAMKITRSLPPILAGKLIQEFHQPYLYYAAMTVLTWADPPVAQRSDGLKNNPYYLATVIGNRNLLLAPASDNGSATVYAGRLFNLGLLLLTIVVTYALAYELSRRHTVALIAAWLMAVQPELAFIGTTFSNDMPAVFMIALALWWLTRMVRVGFTVRRALILGVIIGLGGLCKIHVLIALLPAGLLWLRYDRRIRTGIAIGAGVIVLTGSWMAYNQIVYGDISGYKQLLSGVSRNGSSNDTWNSDVLIALWKSFWMDFSPGMTGFAPNGYYVIASLLVVLVVLAIVVLWLRNPSLRPHLLAHASVIVAVPLVILWQKGNLYAGIPSPPVGEGRHFLIILPSLFLMAALVLGKLPKGYRVIALGIPALANVFLIWATFSQLPATYGISQAALPPLAQPYQFSNGMIVNGLTITKADDGWWIDLQWLTDHPLTRDWSVSAQFIEPKDGGWSGISQEDSYPGNGLKPTTSWHVGETIRDRYWIASKGVSKGKLGIFVYDLATGERVQLVNNGWLIVDIGE